jgi:hypothetical protein
MKPKHPAGPAMTLDNMRELGVRGLGNWVMQPAFDLFFQAMPGPSHDGQPVRSYAPTI